MNKLIKISFILMITALQIPNFSQSNKLFEITPYAETKYFYWGEYNDYSTQILEEYGIIYSLGISGKTKFSKTLQLYLLTDADIYYGIPNYNGFVQNPNGTVESYKSETEYRGIKFLFNTGYDIHLGKHFIIAPEFGLEYEYWERDIDNGGQYGYVELWSLFSLNFGSSFIIPLPPSSKIFLKVFGKYPLIIEESIDLAARVQAKQASAYLEPGGNIGIISELGSVIYGAYISFYLDYSWYSKSAFDRNYYQPESDKSLIGLKIGFSF